MDYFILILAAILSLVGLAGAIIPALPGPPISYIAILLLLVLPTEEANLTFLITSGVAAVIITVLDYIVPIYGTKKLGGDKTRGLGKHHWAFNRSICFTTSWNYSWAFWVIWNSCRPICRGIHWGTNS